MAIKISQILVELKKRTFTKEIKAMQRKTNWLEARQTSTNIG
jgi:hypothetical protein